MQNVAVMSAPCSLSEGYFDSPQRRSTSAWLIVFIARYASLFAIAGS